MNTATQPWSAPAIVPVIEMNPNNRVDPNLAAFYADVQDRIATLEPRQALRYSFPDPKTADRYRNQCRRELTARGVYIRTMIRVDDTMPGPDVYLYIRAADGPAQAPHRKPEAKPDPPAKSEPAPPHPEPKAKPTEFKRAPTPAAPRPEGTRPSPWSIQVGIHDPKTIATVRDLERGDRAWRSLPNEERRPIVAAYIGWMINKRYTLTQAEFNKYKPSFMPTAWGCMQNLDHSSWAAFLDDLQSDD